MKPTKNRIFCNNCHRVKMLFPTKDKADNFIRFNADNIAENNTKVPVRSYFCPACGGWHVTHKEESEEYTRTDEQNEKAFQLGVFVSSLKKNFNKQDWKKWKETLNLHKSWIKELECLPEHRLFLLEAKRQFAHYDKLVAAAEREEQKKDNRQLNEINEERKFLCKNIREKLKDLRLKECTADAERLQQLMLLPAFALSETKVITECREMSDFFLDEEKKKRVERIINTLHFLSGRMNYIPTTDLQNMLTTLADDYNFLTEGLVSKKFIQPLENRVNKCLKYLKSRTESDSGDDTVDKALQLLNTHCEHVRQYLIDAVTALQDGDNDQAVEYLTMADNRLKNLPMSSQKLDLMKYLTAVADKTNLD